MSSNDERSRGSGTTLLEYLDTTPARTLLKRLHLPVLAVDRDGDILFVNAAFTQMVGADPDADVLEGRPVNGWLASADGSNGATALRDMAGRVATWRHREGYEVRATVSQPLLDTPDDVDLLLVLDDVTESEWAHGD